MTGTRFMPSVAENYSRWTEHPWDREGHEWSPGGTAAGGRMFWWRGLLPRVHSHLPADHVVEIGPGFGRWTSHLADQAARLTLIDLTERCIEHCRRKFADRQHLEYWTNDGRSLDMLADESVDFVFSFDSLVHAEATVMREYLIQLARKLKPGGTGFIHHSNLAALSDGGGRIPAWVARTNWRGETMSAALFRAYCREAGLQCASQEIINWVSRSRKADRHRIAGAGMPMTDALSTFHRPLREARSRTQVYVNPLFVHEWRQCTVLADVYDRGAWGREAADDAGSEATPASAIARLSRTAAFAGLVRRVRDRVTTAADYAWSRAQAQRTARAVRRREPILNALLSGRCPDCRAPLAPGNACPGCDVQFFFPPPR